MIRAVTLLAAILMLTGAAHGAVTIVTTQGEEADLAATFSTSDLIQGKIPAELPGDLGWHPVNTDPADHLPAFTDGIGMRSTGLTGLLNDFPGAGNPAKQIDYDLGGLYDISEIRVFSGNNGRDGRVFHTYTAEFSGDGANYTPPIYVQSHPSGTLNNASQPDPPFAHWRAVLTQLTDSAGPVVQSVSHVRLKFFAVDNTGGQMRDPYDGVNQLTLLDDGLTAAFVSPLIWEIDVFGSASVPSDVASVGAARALGNGALVNMTAFAVVSLVPLDGVSFYMQDPDGTAGIRVEPKTSPAQPAVTVGSKVRVSGRLDTLPSGERTIQDAVITEGPVPGGALVIRTVNNRNAGGKGYVNSAGTAEAFGLTDQGLLVKVFGKVTKIEQNVTLDYTFWVDDGSGVDSGNPGGEKGIKVINTGLFMTPDQVGRDFLRVTGVMVSEKVDGKFIRVVRGHDDASGVETLAP